MTITTRSLVIKHTILFARPSPSLTTIELFELLENSIGRGWQVNLARFLSVSPSNIQNWIRKPETMPAYARLYIEVAIQQEFDQLAAKGIAR